MWLVILLFTGCGDPEAWGRAQVLAGQARLAQGESGWSHPLWVDTARECSRVMPWQAEYRDARALRDQIEDGRLAALAGR